MRRYFGKKLYRVLDTRSTEADADKLAKEWREEGFAMRVTVEPGGRYLVWKSIYRYWGDNNPVHSWWSDDSLR